MGGFPPPLFLFLIESDLGSIILIFDEGDPAINGTMFIALTDADLPFTAFNLSMVNPHVAAGPFLYQAG